MARPRRFNADAVLHDAMHVFWAQGYEATSLDDLCAATGLNRSSLYASFGDKRALLLMALEHYIAFAPTRIAGLLAQAVPVRQAMAQLLSSFVDDIVAGPARAGCFVGNCATALAHQDEDVLKLVREGMRRTESAFLDGFTRAQMQGEMKREVDVVALARFFTSSMQGLHMVGKVNPDRKVLGDITATLLRLLD